MHNLNLGGVEGSVEDDTTEINMLREAMELQHEPSGPGHIGNISSVLVYIYIFKGSLMVAIT